jgi:tRNA modification GTPase
MCVLYDTIGAVITAPGKAAVGVIRLSGPDAFHIADQVFRGKKGVSIAQQKQYTMAYGHVMDEKRVIDEVLLLKMQMPSSFTGEDVVEFQAHGGVVVLNRILRLLLSKGARMAEPGEFSKRAFLNGKMGLIQAEAMADLIQADHEWGSEAAMEQMTGALTQKIQAMTEFLLDWMAFLEASVDDPDEDIEGYDQDKLPEELRGLINEIDALLSTMDHGRILRQGLKVTLAGQPNVGKSSLMNVLLQDDRAIVTDIPGTTRDTLEEALLLEGIPIVLCDTAGLGETADIVEQMGIERSKRAMEQADLILYILDAAKPLTQEIIREINAINRNKLLLIINKIDIKPEHEWKEMYSRILPEQDHLYLSVKEHKGLDLLSQYLRERFLSGVAVRRLPVYLTNPRHGAALEKAREALKHAETSLIHHIPLDMVAIDLRQAWLSLGEMTGSVSDDDLIERIFSRFCLGK